MLIRIIHISIIYIWIIFWPRGGIVAAEPLHREIVIMLRTANYKELTGTFLRFVIPSISSQLLSGVYTIVDGYFIGKGVGAAGLAAVGLAFPFTLFVTAVGTGIGVGGGALMSISVGRGRKRLAERILGAMVFLMAAASVLCVFGLTAAARCALPFYQAADARVTEAAIVYAGILLAGSPFQIVAMGMLGAVRNDGFPRKAMYIMIAGFLVNIALDWLWVIVFPFGEAGAAFATLASQLFAAVLLASHFFRGRSAVALRRRLIAPAGRLARKILYMGLPPLGVQIAAAATMLAHNWQALAYGGDMGVAAYAVVGYVVPVGVMLQEGIAEGIQPLVSYLHGANLSARRRITARLGFAAAAAVGLACSALTLAGHSVIPAFFSLSGETAGLASRGILFSAGMFPFLGLAKLGASYFQSTGSLGRASVLTYGDPFVLLPLFLWTLPLVLGMDGVWLAMTFANIALSGVFMVMWKEETDKRVPFSAISFW